MKVRVKTNRGQFELPENQATEQEAGMNKDKEINTGLDDDVAMQQVKISKISINYIYGSLV